MEEKTEKTIAEANKIHAESGYRVDEPHAHLFINIEIAIPRSFKVPKDEQLMEIYTQISNRALELLGLPLDDGTVESVLCESMRREACSRGKWSGWCNDMGRIVRAREKKKARNARNKKVQ